jgi:TldD protein
VGGAETFVSECLKGRPADYVEVRFEDSESTRILVRDGSVESARESVLAGGCVRALCNGGWGFVSFNDPLVLPDKISEAIKLASSAASRRQKASDSSTRLAQCPQVRDSIEVQSARRDPRAVPLASKVRLLLDYCALATSFGSLIRTVQAMYSDRFTRLTFANSEGTYLTQNSLDVSGSIGVIAARGSATQYQVCPFGSSGDYAVVEGLEDDLKAACDLAARLLDAPQAECGEQTVVLDPSLTGVFIHEAFGHLAEADNLMRNPDLAEKMRLGRVLGPASLNVYDTGELHGVRGSLAYDDEGVKTRRVDLLREGHLMGRLHSRETAGMLGEPPTGNARALSHRYCPIPRMRTTCVGPGNATLEDLLKGVSRGIYARRVVGGSTNGENFVLRPGEAYLIRSGRLGPLVRDVVISGDVFETLSRVEAVGSDFIVSDGPGGCGKAGQTGLAVSTGGPTLRVGRLLVAGGWQ